MPLPWPGFLLPGPSEWRKGKCGLKLGVPSLGSKPLSVPLGRLVDLVPPAVGQLSLGDCRVSLLSVVMGHSSYLGVMGSLLVLHAPALDGETLLLH